MFFPYTRALTFLPTDTNENAVETALRPDNNSFIFEAFNGCLDLANRVIASPFLQQLKAGNLNVVRLNTLYLCDSDYCISAQETLRLLLIKMNGIVLEPDHIVLNKKLRSIVESRYYGYIQYNKEFEPRIIEAKKNSVKNDSLREIMTQYANYEREIFNNYDPIYTLSAFLPCYYLWTWFTKKIRYCADRKKDTRKTCKPGECKLYTVAECGNPEVNCKGYSPIRKEYNDWFNANYTHKKGEASFSTAWQVTDGIDAFIKHNLCDKDTAKKIFKQSMQYECAAFEAAVPKS